MADAHDSKSCGETHEGSTPSPPTKQDLVRDAHDSPHQSKARCGAGKIL